MHRPTNSKRPAVRPRAPRAATPRRAYHHGDLRRALLDAALGLIDERGLSALSLREVAKRAGVTHAAPYHHFADRGALMAAIVGEGFDRLYQSMVATIAALGPDAPPDRRLAAAGHGYLRFALAHPAHFRIMFRPELAHAVPMPFREGQTAYHLLEEAVADCQRAGLSPPGADESLLVLAAWSLVHGLASLLLDGPLPVPPDARMELQGRSSPLVEAVPDLFSSLLSAQGARARKPPARRAAARR